MKKRTGGNIFKLKLCLIESNIEDNSTRRTKVLDIEIFCLLGKTSYDFGTFLFGEIGFSVLCRRTLICSLTERNFVEEDVQKPRPWSGTTGRESPVCPRQHLLIRCNTLTSWKEGSSSYKVRELY